MSIYDINAEFRKNNIFGLYQLYTDIDQYYQKNFADSMKAALSIDSILKSGTFFNNSVCHYEFQGKKFLLGVGRFTNVNPFTDDTRTNTTIHDRDPLSRGSNWVRSWGPPDIPLFFIIDLETKEIRFFFMKYWINEQNNVNKFTLSLEDPRIMIHPATNTVLFYAHHNTEIVSGCDPSNPSKAKSTQFYDGMGSNLVAGLNVQEKLRKEKAEKWAALVVDPAKCYPQYPYVSWCNIEDINNLINSHFIAKTDATEKKYRSVPNSVWKPLCANLLNVNAEKNWVIIPQVAKLGDDDVPVFDFVESIGQFTDSVVVYRLLVDTLKKSPIAKNATGQDVFDPSSCNCIYIQTKGGKEKNPGQAVVDKEYFNVPGNNKITVLGNKLKFWLNALLKLFVLFCPVGKTDISSAKFTLEKKADSIQYWYPFRSGKLTTEGKYTTIVKNTTIANDILTNYKVPFIKGISSGGPAIPILGGKAGELLSVGHFKCLHEYVYAVMVAALVYKQDKTFCEFVSTNIQNADGAFVKMSDEEKTVFLDFVRYLTDEVNIFRYTYSVIHTNEPYNAKVRLAENDAIPGSYRELQVLHKDQMYSSYLFKIATTNFEMISVSPQFYIDNSPKDCKGPVLQFSSTITSNGKDTYYIPYGDNDVVGRVVMIGRDDLHNFLRGEKIIKGPKEPNDYKFYFDMARQFLHVHVLKPEPPAP